MLMKFVFNIFKHKLPARQGLPTNPAAIIYNGCFIQFIFFYIYYIHKQSKSHKVHHHV